MTITIQDSSLTKKSFYLFFITQNINISFLIICIYNIHWLCIDLVNITLDFALQLLINLQFFQICKMIKSSIVKILEIRGIDDGTEMTKQLSRS